MYYMNTKQKNLGHLKAFFRGAFLFLFLQVLFAPYITSQTIPSLFVVVDYIKVKPENNAAYLNLEQDIWKPMHEERIRRGIIVGWYLYAVEFSGTGDEYNYVVINLYDSADNLENPWESDIPGQVHPSRSIEEILKSTTDVRQTVKSELFSSIATAPEIPLETPAFYMEVNYMQVDPGKQSAYERLESEVWLPIHNSSIQSGQTTGWGLWKSLFPSGYGKEYQYLTLNSFSNFSTVFGLDFSKAFEDVLSGVDYNEVMQQTQEARTIMRSELWNLIDYAIR